MIDLKHDIKVEDYVILSSNNGEGHLCRYWNNESLDKAKSDMQELWAKNKGGVYYLFKLERIVKAGDYPTIKESTQKIERVMLEKQNDKWSVK
jgi:hypothetical protein